MFNLPLRRAPLCIFLYSCAAAAQLLSLPGPADNFGNRIVVDQIQLTELNTNIFLVNSRNPHLTNVQTPDDSVSRLDLKAPSKAQHEYQQGYLSLMRNHPQDAVDHLTKSLAIYPQFVAAHNALGSAYLNLGQNDLAQGEFTKAVALDDHMPNSYLNLGCADLALKQFPAAEESFRKASSLAPLDVQLQLALAYAEFVNHDYPAVMATAQQVHLRKHDGAAVVHFFAAGACEAQGNLIAAQHEMETLLQEDPKSAYAAKFGQILEQIKAEQAQQAQARLHPPQVVTLVSRAPREPTPEELARRAQILEQQKQFQAQEKKEENQIAEAEAAPDPTCEDCHPTIAVASPAASGSGASPDAFVDPSAGKITTPTIRISVDEVAMFFAAMDHGKPVTNLAASDIVIRDNRQPPVTILGFRNESQLPLRLGLVIDTSASVAGRLSFELAAASRFLQDVVVDKDDLAFVVGVNNAVRLVQDFTADQTLRAHAIDELAPGGGTALWDAVAFAADKLATHPESQPVARILVVISDGQDNSSSVTLKQAIATAQSGEVAVYTVGTSDEMLQDPSVQTGDHALRTLSDLTGGAAFLPGSARHLEASLADLQQVIRGRYLVSYKPASFQRDGRYRSIDIEAEKDGRKLLVIARKGYYAPTSPTTSPDR
jgi:Ca-activated chloride channel homolog